MLKECLFVSFIALSFGRVWLRLLQPLAQSLIGSPGTLAGATWLKGTPTMDLGPMNIDLTYTFEYCFEVAIRIRLS